MAGLVLLLAVVAGTLVQWSSPAPTSRAAPDRAVDEPRPDDLLLPTGGTEPTGPTSARTIDPVALGGGFLPDDTDTEADAVGDGASDDVGADDDGDVVVIDSATGQPLGADWAAPWWQRALPVSGRLVPIEGTVRGHVRLDVVGPQAVQVTLTDVRVTDPARVASVRIELSSGDVLGDERAQWVGVDQPVDVGSFTPDGEHPVLTVVDPHVLPDVVHAVLLVDDRTGRVLGGAELLPAP